MRGNATTTIAVLVALSSGCDALRWKSYEGPPASFEIDATKAITPTSVFFAGRRGASLDDSRAVVYGWNGANAALFYEGRGYIVALDVRGSSVWAVRGQIKPSHNGSDYFLVRSNNLGKTWHEVAPIDAQSICQMVAKDDREAWIRGAGVLAQTIDGGATWHSVPEPLTGNCVTEPLALLGNRIALLASRTVTTTDGIKWETCAACGHARVSDGESVLREASEGRFDVAFADGTRSAQVAYRMVPTLLDVDGECVRIVGAPVGSDVGSGLVLFESHNRGATFSRSRMPAFKDQGVAIVHHGPVVALDVVNNVRVAQPACSLGASGDAR